jgi:hypothetical protein
VAKYPTTKTSRPYFAIAINASLYGDSATRNQQSGDGTPPATVRTANLILPSRTVIFFEGGLPDETPLPGQTTSNYNGSPNGGAPNVVARYNASGSNNIQEQREATLNLIFGDGHLEQLPAKSVLDTSGKAYDPQLEQNGGNGKVSWTLDPEAKVN